RADWDEDGLQNATLEVTPKGQTTVRGVFRKWERRHAELRRRVLRSRTSSRPAPLRTGLRGRGRSPGRTVRRRLPAAARSPGRQAGDPDPEPLARSRLS